jgi:mRNA-degrading endonuclease YafQ of YafQ-DinJ toxin-antitoxin module
MIISNGNLLAKPVKTSSSFRLGYDLRVIFKHYEEKLELVRIGTHNQLYRYK